MTAAERRRRNGIDSKNRSAGHLAAPAAGITAGVIAIAAAVVVAAAAAVTVTAAAAAATVTVAPAAAAAAAAAATTPASVAGPRLLTLMDAVDDCEPDVEQCRGTPGIGRLQKPPTNKT